MSSDLAIHMLVVIAAAAAMDLVITKPSASFRLPKKYVTSPTIFLCLWRSAQACLFITAIVVMSGRM
ncbi:hypothetical protein [Sphingomicrobium flavum]|uniref:hypothetical protein n=1 Tax=Sphingomicrobium flavum TaxID=1229164 RepID=UPI0021AD78D3|nr:hypothetical protein [Sphingomicrobium flavum]